MCLFNRLLILILLPFIVTSCGPCSLDDFKEEGEGVIRSLIQELRAIHTRDQLLAASGKLQRLFDRLVFIIIAAEEFSFAHPELAKRESMRHNHELSDQLRGELNRLYRLEGGRQILEKYQEKALHRLDAFEKRHAK
jgi:hypothetical protein